MATNTSTTGSFFEGLQMHAEGVDLSLNSTLALIRRRWMILAGTLAAVLALTVAALMVMPRFYTASALLQINTRSEQVVNVDDVVSGLTASDPAIRTEIDVMTSRRIAQRVIEELHLLRYQDEGAGAPILGSLLTAAKMYLGWQDPAMTSRDEERKRAMTAAVNRFLDNLEVEVLPRSYTIRLRYTDRDAEQAAQITNAVAQAYLNSQLEDRFEATKRANDWVNGRLKELRQNVQEADLAVKRFREAHGLTEARGVTLTEQQLSELNSQLIIARTQLAEAQAKFNRSKELMATGGGGIDTASEVINNPLIQNLRQQETEVRREMSDLAARYGAKHPRMITIKRELADIRSKIGEESRKIQGSLGNEVAVAQARVATLEDQLDRLEAQTQLSGNAEVQLVELERQANANRSLYEAFLNRSKEIAQMDFAQSDAKVISAAETPLTPSSPRVKLMLALAILGGLTLGGLLVLLLEVLDSGFRTVAQVESTLGLPVLGMLGEMPANVDVARYVSLKPNSALAESVRAIKTAVQYANPDKEMKVWAITSSVPEEGKTTAALALAQTLAMNGDKVLLVDADLRRPSIGRHLSIAVEHTLGEVLLGQAKFEDVVRRDRDAKIDVLPARHDTKFAQELLASGKMKDLMADLRKRYDAIVLDTPPVMAVADVVALSPMVDALLYSVRWGTTPRALAATAIRQLRTAHVAVVGAIFSRVDLERQIGYGAGDYSYYYGRYKGYYED